MKSEEKNFSGRIVPPWYDSDSLCFILIIFSIISFFFGISGIFTALGVENSDFYLRIPIYLTGMSFYLCLSLTLRLVKRRKINKSLQSLDFYR